MSSTILTKADGVTGGNAVITPEALEQLEGDWLRNNRPQVGVDIRHRFGPGVYLRELTVPAGTIVVGHHHKFAHTNLMTQGRITLFKPDGTRLEITPPFTMVAPPGRKVFFAHEKSVWVNVYATDQTDVDVLEEMLLDKTQTHQLSEGERRLIASATHQADRDDFQQFLEENKFTEAWFNSVVENESDLTPMPMGWPCKFQLSPSAICGRGIFASAELMEGEVIGPARLGQKRTPLGRFVNHAKQPNAQMVKRGDDIDLVALQKIEGYAGGKLENEITVNYRKAIQVCRQ